MSEPDIMITIRDVQAALTVGNRGFCIRGARAWFDQHQINFAEFIRNGYPLRHVEIMQDQFAQKVAAYVRAKHEDGK